MNREPLLIKQVPPLPIDQCAESCYHNLCNRPTANEKHGGGKFGAHGRLGWDFGIDSNFQHERRTEEELIFYRVILLSFPFSVSVGQMLEIGHPPTERHMELFDQKTSREEFIVWSSCDDAVTKHFPINEEKMTRILFLNFDGRTTRVKGRILVNNHARLEGSLLENISIQSILPLRRRIKRKRRKIRLRKFHWLLRLMLLNFPLVID